MSRASKYKYEKGDTVGLYRIIRPLPSEPNVKNLVIYCECLLCGDKVKRWSNRLDSKHRGCSATAKVDKQADPIVPVVAPVPHLRPDGKVVKTRPTGFVDRDEPTPEQLVAEATAEASPDQTSLTDDDSEDFNLPDALELPKEVADALNIDVDAQAIEIIRLAKDLDPSTNFIFMNTFKRYLTLVHLARRLERKINHINVELTVVGSTGTQVANPLIIQYKQVSAESNAVIKVLLGIVAKMNAGAMDEDPLIKALAGA